MAKISGSDAVLKVIQKWGVKHIYGLPGGSFRWVVRFNDERHL